MRTYDPDTARRRLDFSVQVLDAILHKPFNLCLEWMLEQIGRPVNVDRIAYLRSGKDMHDLYLAAGYGNHLPIVSSRQVQITPEQLSKLRSGGWIWTPTEDIGWDAFFSFRSNGMLGVIAIDDTSSERIFTEADQEFLAHAARWFGKCYEARNDIDHDRRRATMDALTKLPNQRTTIERLKETVDGIMSGKIKQAAVTLIDIDNFKSVNDNFGHPFGDTVLKALAEILGSHPSVFAGRYGGEEFMVISYEDGDASVALIDEFLEQFRQVQFMPENAGKPYNGSFSAGTYTIERSRLPSKDVKQSADYCYRQADTLMYRAKHSGKARVCAG
ncbi:diguanylate cyclase [Candidatus Uhrbacteria bacterium]|nr:diguanylate cyclase [Candidatus Uhrbacteria bacterium]